MNWIKIEDFKFDRTGRVLVVMNNAKKKNDLIVREDSLYYAEYEKSKWYEPIIKSGSSVSKEVDDTHIQLWGFIRVSFKNVKAIMFMDDILNDYLTNIEK